jgi:hypothetical protein
MPDGNCGWWEGRFNVARCGYFRDTMLSYLRRSVGFSRALHYIESSEGAAP